MLVSSVSDGSMKGEAAGAAAENGSIERFYPLTSSTPSENAGFHSGAGADANSVVLIDCINEPFFADLTTWLVEMGIRGIVVAKSTSTSTSTQDNGIDESVLFHLESLRKLGVAVSVVWEPLSTTHENRFSMQLRATLSQGVKAVVFGREEVDMDMEDLHQVAQRVFSGHWAPEIVLIFTSTDESIFSQPTESSSTHAHSVADLWATKGPSAGLLSTFQSQPDFNELVPALEALFSSTKASASASVEPSRAKFITYGLSPAITYSLLQEKETEISSQTRDKFSIILQTAAAHAQSNGTNMPNGEATTPTAAAMARFCSIPAENADARRNAATDAVAEVLAELLFIPKEQINMQANLTVIGIDSLIASELRKQVGELFEKDVSTGWVLSGEVKAGDIVDLVLR